MVSLAVSDAIKDEMMIYFEYRINSKVESVENGM